ncbi:MAG TPA: serine protease [Solirubrobacterales bacterium]|nr:serine protease [Solirubrobacterales bacterium]
MSIGARVFLVCLMAVAGLAAVPAGSAAAPGLSHLGLPGRASAVAPSGSTPTPRVVGGTATSSSGFPWQVELIIEKTEGTFLCGGTLIHPYVVLTAAHCLTNEYGELETGTEVTAWLGRTSLESGGTPIEAYDLWVPNAYDPYAHSFDIGFVSLWEPSSLPRLQIAGPTERALWTAGRSATISGWGLTSEEGSLAPVLQAATVSIIDDATCAGPGINGLYGFSATTMVCAGNLAGGTGTCHGDSGGPLQVPIDGGGYRLVGVTDWGVGCAQPNKPGVFARVADEPLRGFIANALPEIESADEIPPTGTSVIGSGARPPGCGAAEAGVTAAAAGAARARGALRSAKAALHRAERTERRRPSRRAGHRVKARRRGLRLARRNAAGASAAVAAAEESRTSICG